MSKRAGLFASFLVLVLVVQIVVLAPRNLNDQRGIGSLSAAETSQPDVDQAMRGVHLVETRDGEREWELWADEALAFKSRNIWELKQVKVVLFSEKGTEFTVTGDAGEIETGSKNLKVSGHVVTRSSNGYVMKTDLAAYDSESRSLASPGRVEMTGPKDEKGNRINLVGEGLRADLVSSLIEINHSVRSERRLPPDRLIVIRSDGARFSARKKMAQFLGNVVMDMDQMRITGPEAEFEYASDQELVKSIAVKGGVKVSDAEKFATAENLNVQFEQDKYVFKGHPRVVQDNDEMRGDEIVFLEGGKKVLVQKVRAKVDEKSLEKAR